MPSIDLASPGGDRDDVTPDSIGYAIGEGRGADLGTPVRHPAGGGGCQPRRRPCRASDRPPVSRHRRSGRRCGDAASLILPDHGRLAIGADHGPTYGPDAGDPPPHPGRAFRPHPARRAADVVASLWDVRQRYPESWGRLGGLDDMARLCNRHLRIAQSIRGRHDTFIMLYNDLIAHNAATLETLAAPPRRSSARSCQPDMCQAAVGPGTDTAGSAAVPAGRSAQ